MKKIRIFSSPSTEYEVIKEVTVYAPNDQVYFVPEGVEFHKTQEQSEKYIKDLEEQLHAANKKLSDVLDIIYPERHNEDGEGI
jgi:hypothetical protein